MHTALLRANVIFFYNVTVLFVLAMACAASFHFVGADVAATISNVEIVHLHHKSNPYISGDEALMLFDCDADLAPVWNWNVKLLYVWIQANYVGSDGSGENEFVVWDRLIESPEDAVIALRRARSKYHLIGDNLRGVDVTLTLHWDRMPVVGLLQFGAPTVGTSGSATLPSRYQSVR
jgi:signal peptidase complex subunit 3